jgi:hypothetical protein
MLQLVKDLEQLLMGLISELYNSLESETKYEEIYTDSLKETKYLKRLINLIDLILKIKQKGDLCRNSASPTDDELRNLWTQIGVKYNIQVGVQIDKPSTTPTSSVSTVVQQRMQMDDCLKRIPSEDMDRVIAWINDLKGQG